MKDNIETNYLIFISSDGKKAGFEIFKERIEKNKWPIYKTTPQLLNVKEEKNVIFYIAGTGEKKQCFVGYAKIKKIIDRDLTEADPNQEFRQVLCNVEFKDFRTFKKEIPIKDHIDNLSFIKNKEKYGLYFQGGVCKINKQSYDYLIDIQK